MSGLINIIALTEFFNNYQLLAHVCLADETQFTHTAVSMSCINGLYTTITIKINL